MQAARPTFDHQRDIPPLNRISRFAQRTVPVAIRYSKKPSMSFLLRTLKEAFDIIFVNLRQICNFLNNYSISLFDIVITNRRRYN